MAGDDVTPAATWLRVAPQVIPFHVQLSDVTCGLEHFTDKKNFSVRHTRAKASAVASAAAYACSGWSSAHLHPNRE